jgi:hypothetical protein
MTRAGEPAAAEDTEPAANAGEVTAAPDAFVVSAEGPAIPVTNTADWPTVRGPASRPAILAT